MNPRRRSITFASLDDVMPDVDRLLLGYEQVGNWSLGQICNHVGLGVRSTVEGFPVRAPWLVRKLIAPLVRENIFKTGQMREGIKVPAAVLPKTGLDDRAEAEALRAALKLYMAHTAPMAPHPFFETLSRERWDRFHCIHCAHHLSFVLPRASS
jgi:Protein of unknown function (DUF1569)